MLEKKTAVKICIISFIYILFTTQLHYLKIEDAELSHVRHLVKGLLDMLPLIGWFYFLKTRVVQPLVCRYLIIGSLVMQFSMFIIYLQTIVVTEDINLMALSVIGIFLPYCIYPVFSLLASLCLGMPEQYRLPRRYYVLILVSAVIAVLAFTNSFHHLFFKFSIMPDDINRTDITLGPICYLSVAFALWVYVYRMKILRDFSGKNAPRFIFPVILALVLSCIVYHIPYIMNGFTMKWEFIGSTQYTFYIEVIIWIICMSTGLVPVNTGHERIFARSTLRFKIADKSGKVLYPAGGDFFDGPEFEALTREGTVKVGDSLLRHSYPLKNKGYVIWDQDISYVNELASKQEELRAVLKEQESELQNELTLANETEKVRQKKAIYEKIDDILKADIGILETLVKRLGSSDGSDTELIKDIIRRGIYIKRKSNLLIMNEKCRVVPLSELKLTADEMLSGLFDAESDSLYLVPLTGYVKTTDIIACLDLLMEIFIKNHLNALHLRLESSGEDALFKVYCEMANSGKVSSELKLSLCDK
jgi:hypothetical protein